MASLLAVMASLLVVDDDTDLLEAFCAALSKRERKGPAKKSAAARSILTIY
jgi:hypothetical protein